MLKAKFKIVTGSSIWGKIHGDIMEQQDLQDELSSISGGLADSITALDDKFTSITGGLDDKIDSVNGALSDSISAVDNKYDSITGALSDSITGLDNKYDSITGALDDKIDSINGALSDSIQAVDDKYNSITGGLSDSITALDSVVSSNFTTLSDSIVALDSVVSDNYNTLDGKIDSINGALSDSITALDSVVSSNFTTLSDSITNNYNTLDSLIGGVDDKIDVHIADVNNPHSVTASQVGLGNVDNTSDADKPVSTAQQSALDNKVTKNADITAATKCKITYDAKGLVTGGADLQQSDIPALNLTKISDVTATAAEVNILDGATLSTTELNYVDGVTSSIQTQIDGKQPTVTGAATTIVSNNLTTGRAVVSDANGKIAASDITSTELDYLDNVTSNIQTQFNNITDVIPAAASDTNQLADKNFVNSSIATNTANFIGTFNSVADLEAYSGTLTNNDYAFVITTDALGNTAYDRYKYTTATTPASWVFEYELNNSSFTSDQWAAINSLITADTKVTHTANTAVGNSTTPVYVDASGNATALSCTLATSVPVGAVFTDTTYTFATGSTNGTIAVSVNGGAATDVSVKGLGSAAYTSSGDYATAAQGTKADSAIQSVKVNGTALMPDANKAVDVTVPTKISNLSDDTATYPIDKADTLTGLTATIAELNYVGGVTSSIQTQLNGKVPTTRTVNSKALSSDVTLNLADLGNVTISSPTTGQNLTYDGVSQVWKNTSVSATIAWGGITGTLSDQTDLQNALNGKVSTNTAITGATKCKITYDAKGLVTSGADLQASDIPNLTLSKITDVTASASELNILDGATLTTTELNYVDGVTSSIQTQLNGKLTTSDIVSSVSSSSTNSKAVGAKLFYDTCGDIETLINAL